MRNDRKFHDCSALYVTCFKIDMTTTYSDHQSDSLLPTHWKTISLNSAKTLLISHYKWNIWSLCCKNHSIACSSSSGNLGVKQPIFARLADILSLPERIVAWSRLQRRTMDSLSPTQRIALQHHNSSQGTITIQCKYTWKITFALEEHCKYWCRQDRQNRKSAFRAERSYTKLSSTSKLTTNRPRPFNIHTIHLATRQVLRKALLKEKLSDF